MCSFFSIIKIKREKKCTYYYCKCDCGNELWVRSDCLVSGNTKSCGCLNKENRFKTKDIKGKKINKLTAIEPTNKRDKNNGSVIWECKCDCKNIAYVSYGDLVFGKTKSCGCAIPEASKENIKKAYKKNIKNNIVEGTNLATISKNEPIASNTSGVTGVRWDKSKNKWNEEDVRQKLTANIFKENKLYGMLYSLFNGSPFEAIDTAYPGKFKKTDFKRQGKQRK